MSEQENKKPAREPYPYPRTLKCIVTGEERMVGREVIEKRIAKAGSLENLINTYVCLSTRQLLREGHSVEEIRKMRGSDITTPVAEEIIEKYRPVVKEKKAREPYPYQRAYPCIVSGVERKVGREVLEKRIEKAGSYEEYKRTYVCSESKRLLREGKTVEEIRKMKGSTLTTEVPPEILELYKPKVKKEKQAPKASPKKQSQEKKEYEAVFVDPDYEPDPNSEIERKRATAQARRKAAASKKKASSKKK